MAASSDFVAAREEGGNVKDLCLYNSLGEDFAICGRLSEDPPIEVPKLDSTTIATPYVQDRVANFLKSYNMTSKKLIQFFKENETELSFRVRMAKERYRVSSINLWVLTHLELEKEGNSPYEEVACLLLKGCENLKEASFKIKELYKKIDVTSPLEFLENKTFPTMPSSQVFELEKQPSQKKQRTFEPKRQQPTITQQSFKIWILQHVALGLRWSAEKIEERVVKWMKRGFEINSTMIRK